MDSGLAFYKARRTDDHNPIYARKAMKLFIRLRQNTLQRAVAIAALSRRRLAAGSFI